MGQVRPSNYEIMRDRMEMEFIKYDQAKMIQKFSLQHDADFLYIRFAGREYRIGRKSGRVGVVLRYESDTGAYDCYSEAYVAQAQKNADLIRCTLGYVEDSNLISEKLVSDHWDAQFLVLEPGQETSDHIFGLSSQS